MLSLKPLSILYYTCKSKKNNKSSYCIKTFFVCSCLTKWAWVQDQISDNNFPTEKKYRARVLAAAWPISWQNKNKCKEKQIRRLNKLKTKQNSKQAAQRGHSNTVGNGWHLKMVKWQALAVWPLLNNVDPDWKYYVILVIVCHLSYNHFVYHLSVSPSLHHALLLMAPQGDKWHWTMITLNFTGITMSIAFEQYMHIFRPHILVWTKLYALWKKNLVWESLEFCKTDVWQNFEVFQQQCVFKLVNSLHSYVFTKNLHIFV